MVKSMSDNVIKGRLQTPVNEKGERTDIHLVTDAECVIVRKTNNMTGAEEVTTLDKVLKSGTSSGGDGGIVIGNTEPDHSCIWFNVD